jgi:hypothetical protein
MWDALETFILSVVLAGGLFGYPIYLVYNKWLNKKEPKNYPFRQPAIFANSLGHLIMIEPDPEIQEKVIYHFKNNKEESQRLLMRLRKNEKW